MNSKMKFNIIINYKSNQKTNKSINLYILLTTSFLNQNLFDFIIQFIHIKNINKAFNSFNPSGHANSHTNTNL